MGVYSLKICCRTHLEVCPLSLFSLLVTDIGAQHHKNGTDHTRKQEINKREKKEKSQPGRVRKTKHCRHRDRNIPALFGTFF